jgi:hypothetical protein
VVDIIFDIILIFVIVDVVVVIDVALSMIIIHRVNGG